MFLNKLKTPKVVITVVNGGWATPRRTYIPENDRTDLNLQYNPPTRISNAFSAFPYGDYLHHIYSMNYSQNLPTVGGAGPTVGQNMDN